VKASGDPLPPFGKSRPPVYSETPCPRPRTAGARCAYSDASLRYIEAPRVELYDHVADPAESRIPRAIAAAISFV
jgi:hypothetical protein